VLALRTNDFGDSAGMKVGYVGVGVGVGLGVGVGDVEVEDVIGGEGEGVGEDTGLCGCIDK
jgi:hypothetical protein